MQELGHHIHVRLLNRKVPAYRTPYRVPVLDATSNDIHQKWNNDTHGHNNVWADHHHGYGSINITIYNITNIYEWTVPPHHFHHQAGIYLLNNTLHSMAQDQINIRLFILLAVVYSHLLYLIGDG